MAFNYVTKRIWKSGSEREESSNIQSVGGTAKQNEQERVGGLKDDPNEALHGAVLGT